MIYELYDLNELEILFLEVMMLICNNWYGVYFENKNCMIGIFLKEENN